MSRWLYLASARENGGVYKYAFDGEKYVRSSFFAMPTPMYMVTTNGGMHILLRAPFDNKESG